MQLTSPIASCTTVKMCYQYSLNLAWKFSWQVFSMLLCCHAKELQGVLIASQIPLKDEEADNQIILKVL